MAQEVPVVARFSEHLRTESRLLKLPRKGSVKWNDAKLHEDVFGTEPDLYALMALHEAEPGQQAHVLFRILQVSQAHCSVERRAIFSRTVAVLLKTLHPDQVLSVFLMLRRERVNHKHSSRAIVTYILNHPHSDAMVSRRRQVVKDCLEHAVGKNVLRACARMLAESSDNAYTRRNLLRFARDPIQASRIIRSLFEPTSPSSQTVTNDVQPHVAYSRRPPTPHIVTATNRGEISSTLVHIYRGGPSPELVQALAPMVKDAAQGLPPFHGRIALVLDASASMRGYGEREFCCIAQSVALQLVLQEVCANLSIHQIGGTTERPPRPEGPTDLCMPLLDALASDPAVVAIVSDGYENLRAGDLSSILRTLPLIGIDTPITFCHSKFTDKDDLSARRPAWLCEFEFWHQNDFSRLIFHLIANSHCAERDIWLRTFLLTELERLEKTFANQWQPGETH